MQELHRLRMKYFPKPCDNLDNCRPSQIWTSLEAGHGVSHIHGARCLHLEVRPSPTPAAAALAPPGAACCRGSKSESLESLRVAVASALASVSRAAVYLAY